MITFQTFAKKIKPLHNSEKKILQILTICHEPLSQVNLAKLLKSCEVHDNQGKIYRTNSIRELKRNLTETGWLGKDLMSRIACHPNYKEYLMRIAILNDDFPFWLKEIRKLKEFKISFTPLSFEVTLREFRIAIYIGDIALFNECERYLIGYYKDKWRENEFVKTIFLPFDSRWFATYKPEIQSFAIDSLVTNKCNKLENIDDLVDYLETHDSIQSTIPLGSFLRNSLNKIYALRGETKKVLDLLPYEQNELSRHIRTGWSNFLLGQYKEANENFTKATKLLRLLSGRRKSEINSIAGVIHVLNILALKENKYLKKIQTIQQNTKGSGFYDKAFSYLKAVTFFHENRLREMNESMQVMPTHSMDTLIWSVCMYWNEVKIHPQNFEKLENFFENAFKNKYLWMAMEFAGALSKLTSVESIQQKYEQHWLRLQKKLGIKSMRPFVTIIEPWERSLQALLSIKPKKKRGGKNSGEGKMSRLVWLVDFENNHLQPKEQTASKSGKWSKGRNVALKRLKEEGTPSMTEQDSKVCKYIKMYSYGYYGHKEYAFNYEEATKSLVGHPLLFRMDSPGISVELIEKEPELIVEEKDGVIVLKFEEKLRSSGGYIFKETPTRYVLLNINETHNEINQLLNSGQLRIPKKAKKQVIQAIGNLSAAVTIHSAVGGKSKDLPTIKADATTYIHLLPLGDGFKLEFFVKPFKSEPPYFKPGAGREHIITEINGTRTQAKRRLQEEIKNADFVENACPTFRRIANYNQEWKFDELEDCLNVLLELEPLKKAKKIILEHPKGEKLRLVGQAGFGNLSMTIKKERDWFGMDGKLKIDGKKVLDFRQLLAAVEHTDMPFVQLNDGEFLALTQDMQRKLKEINSLIHKNKNSLQFHPLTSPVLEDFTDLLDDLKVDSAWKEQVSKMAEARTVNPKVPSTFKAILREYQQEGFRWLSQLAHWGVGACLADDMGLGKTIQGLAVLLNRAKEGPALVVAPASVARNWLRETEKFAPTLHPMLFGGSNRKKMIENLKPFDLLICSYGLMQQEGELLATQNFNTIILDEAQAIKNRSTKRAKAAMGLQANFKVLTTGTPIENHLAELWSLFNFLNPGFLGSASFFNENYAIPIEKNNNKETRQQLKRLIQPFILRRRKNDVLQELPPKTEITLTVQLSDEERAFYEALRQTAVENIEGMGEENNKRFAILAELMKLRQACCHPKMVLPSSSISSSKLNLFGETISELLENGHKALVFSQFVKHLKLVEKWLQEKGISYQYLDGSTSLPKREVAINAFQAGEGDVFLISLKAGGTGLNLTAADYVIHLDPWWNPAVEDQASDRAHRIGQKRPVTIYRLVAEETIEEKIVKLHAEKRDLADSLLEGTEASAKLSATDLLDLIRGN